MSKIFVELHHPGDKIFDDQYRFTDLRAFVIILCRSASDKLLFTAVLFLLAKALRKDFVFFRLIRSKQMRAKQIFRKVRIKGLSFSQIKKIVSFGDAALRK